MSHQNRPSPEQPHLNAPVLVYCSKRFEDHQTGNHPESPTRIRSIRKRLAMLSEDSRFQFLDSAPLPEDLQQRIEAVHDREYLLALQRFSLSPETRWDADTVVTGDSLPVAQLALSMAMQAVDNVITGETPKAFCAIRPPGHHARPHTAMGFCLYNNIAVIARYAQQKHKLQNILIVDWDVHHGNGTQEMFYTDPHIHFVSSHRHPFYPGTGMAEETGSKDGLGTTWNLPLAMGTAEQTCLEQLECLIEQASMKCQPELILVSAGFDAHRLDPIGSLGWSTAAFERLTTFVCQVADQYCNGKVLSLLEGGYNVDALADCVEVHLKGLAG